MAAMKMERGLGVGGGMGGGMRLHHLCKLYRIKHTHSNISSDILINMKIYCLFIYLQILISIIDYLK